MCPEAHQRETRGHAYLLQKYAYFFTVYVNECFLVLEMRRMVREMLDEVDQIDRNNSVCEDLYGKLE